MRCVAIFAAGAVVGVVAFVFGVAWLLEGDEPKRFLDDLY